MVTVSLYKMDPVPEKLDILFRLEGEKKGDFSFRAKNSENDEIEVIVTYEEDLETGMKRVFSLESLELTKYLREKGKQKIERKIFCFINLKDGTVEIYRGKDFVTERLKESFQSLLGIKLTQVLMSKDQLLSLANFKSEEIKQAIFKSINGLWYEVLRGNSLERNQQYLTYVSSFPDSLRVLSIIPKINWVNGSKYMVTFDGDRGTIAINDGLFRSKPRSEVKQCVSLMLGKAS